jgi:hypothetical protein
MQNKPWIVKKRSGETWGQIRKVVIDPATRQIVSVDVLLNDIGGLVRVSWASLRIQNEDIVLCTSEREVETTIIGASGASLSEAVMLEVSVPPAFHL